MIEEIFGHLKVTYSPSDCKEMEIHPSEELSLIVRQEEKSYGWGLQTFLLRDRLPIRERDDLRAIAAQGKVFEAIQSIEECEFWLLPGVTSSFADYRLRLQPSEGYSLLAPRLIELLATLYLGEANVDSSRPSSWDPGRWIHYGHRFSAEHAIVCDHIAFGDALYDPKAVHEELRKLAREITPDEIALFAKKLDPRQGGVIEITLPDYIPEWQCQQLKREVESLFKS